MQDEPTPAEILKAVATLLREEILPQLTGSAAFHVRVAANAVDLVRREIIVPAGQLADEAEALQDLLGMDGSARDLGAELARKIARRSIGLETPGLEALLWSMTEAKLAVDQPNYAGLAQAKLLRGKT